MSDLKDLDKLISEVLGYKLRGMTIEEAEKKKSVALTTDKAIPAVPYPRLQLTDNWGKAAEGEGFDIKLFQLAGLGKAGVVIADRTARLAKLVDCGSDCPTEIREIIARLSVMEMFSTVMTSFVSSSKGYLFENFMALVLKGATVEGNLIQDVEVMRDNQSSTATMPVSLKLLKDESAFHGSLKNLHKSVMVDGKPIVYIVGYKKADGSAVELWYLKIDKEFFTKQPLSSKDKENPKTLMSLYQKIVGEEKDAKSQFTIYPSVLFNRGTPVGIIPIYEHKQLKEKAELLTAGINQIVTEIYESLNLFSQQLTKFYIEGAATGAGGKARAAYDRLAEAIKEEKGLK